MPEWQFFFVKIIHINEICKNDKKIVIRGNKKMKMIIGRLIAAYALNVAKTDVNCTCRGWCYQPLLPKQIRRLKKNKHESDN